MLHLHDEFGVPNNGIGMEVGGWIKPKVKLLFPIALPLAKYIGMKGVRLPTHIP